MKYKAEDVVVFRERYLFTIVGRTVRSEPWWECASARNKECFCKEDCCDDFYKYETTREWVCERQIRIATDQEEFLYLLNGREVVKLKEIKE